MKRIAAFITAVLLLFSNAIADIDLSSMTLEELNALKQQINLEIASRPEVKSVTVPVGVWEIGKDIPARYWTLTAAGGYNCDEASIIYCSELDDSGNYPSFLADTCYFDYLHVPDSSFNLGKEYIDIDMKSGMYLIIDMCPVVFTPYSGGKADLGFDW